MHFQYLAFVLSSQLLGLISYLRVDTFTVCLPLLINFSIHNFLVSSNGLFFSTYKISFSISCKVGQVVLNSLSFCLSVKLLISPSSLNEGLSV